jgi:hypothetical protein
MKPPLLAHSSAAEETSGYEKAKGVRSCQGILRSETLVLGTVTAGNARTRAVEGAVGDAI